MHEVYKLLMDDIHEYIDKNKPMNKDKWAYLKPYLDEMKDIAEILYYTGEDTNGNKYSDYDEMSSGYSMRTRRTMPNTRMTSGTNSYRNNGRSMNSNRGYSRSNDPKQTMLDNLYEAMDMATSEEERMSIQKCIDKLEY